MTLIIFLLLNSSTRAQSGKSFRINGVDVATINSAICEVYFSQESLTICFSTNCFPQRNVPLEIEVDGKKYDEVSLHSNRLILIDALIAVAGWKLADRDQFQVQGQYNGQPKPMDFIVYVLTK